jgi:hypothetical protein
MIPNDRVRRVAKAARTGRNRSDRGRLTQRTGRNRSDRT